MSDALLAALTSLGAGCARASATLPARCAVVALAAVGGAVVLRNAALTLATVHRSVLRLPHLDLRRWYSGGWAVVTGAGDGIGRAMALDLARRGFDVVLISRTRSKLEAVEAAIAEQSPGRRTLAITFDFSKAAPEDYAAVIDAQLRPLDVALLVNNVGAMSAAPGPFEAGAISDDLYVLRVNTEPAVWMTKMLLPRLKQRSTKVHQFFPPTRRCGIVFVSSAAGISGAPLLATYAASKGFVHVFAESLVAEAVDAGARIDVLSVTPGFVHTNTGHRDAPAFDCPDADEMASQTLDQLPAGGQTFGHRNHVLIALVYQSLPRWAQRKAVADWSKDYVARSSPDGTAVTA